MRDARVATADPLGFLGATSQSRFDVAPYRGLPTDLGTAVAILIAAEQRAEADGVVAFARLSGAERARVFDRALMNTSLQALIRGRHARAGLPILPARPAAENKIDTNAMLRAAQTLETGAELALPYLRSYALSAPHEQLAGACDRPGPLFCDPANIVEIWGTENDDHATESPAVIRVDLGGNDTYRDHTATAETTCGVFGDPPPDCLHGAALAMNLDVSGNDTYLPDNPTSSDDLRQGVGIGGVGVLFDAEGNDTYSALNGQGFGYDGVGVLVDGLGNDSYVSGAAQGVGFGGAGLLFDGSGNDQYSAVLGQGVGLFGAGALIDAKGNDTYLGSQLAQGVGDIGAGALIDASGNDQYTGVPGAAYMQGMAANGGAGALVDLSGNDRYSPNDCSLGCATAGGTVSDLVNSNLGTNRFSTDTFALFLDASGSDTYRTPGLATFGWAGSLSMARFLDLGHGNDSYLTANTNPGNNKTWRQGQGTVLLLNVNTRIPAGEGDDR